MLNMRHLTTRQRAFCKALVAQTGKRNGSEAARIAGYPANRAACRASRNLRNPRVIAEINRLEANLANGLHDALEGINFTDALVFLLAVMADGTQDLGIRLEAAKAILPYTHAKPAARSLATPADLVNGRFTVQPAPDGITLQ